MAVGCWLLAIGHWLLAFSYWLLVIGQSLLAFGYWLLTFKPCKECSEFEFFEQFGEAFHIRFFYFQFFFIEVDRNVSIYCSEFFRHHTLLCEVDDIFAHLAFQFIGISYEVLNGVVFSNQLRSVFLADARYSRNVIGSVAPESEYVDDLFWTSDAVFFANVFWSEHFCWFASFSRLINEDILTDELSEVFVWCHHESCEAFFFCFFSQSSDNVVGLVAFAFEDRYVESLYYFLDIRHRNLDVGRCLFTICLIIGEIVGAKSWCAEVEGDTYMSRFLVFQHFVQSVEKSHNSRSVETFRVDSWVFI